MSAIERVEARILSMEVAADAERRIFAAYAPEWAEWESRNSDPAFKSSDKLVMQIRNALDARNNAERFEKEAADLRELLALAKQASPVSVGEAFDALRMRMASFEGVEGRPVLHVFDDCVRSVLDRLANKDKPE